MPSSKPRKKAASRNPAAGPSRTSQIVPTPSAPDDRYAPNTWLSGGLGGTEEITVPSGQTCLVRKPGVQGLMKAGVLRNLDSLTSLVDKKHVSKGKKSGGINIGSLMKDPKALDGVMHTVDKVTCHCVVQPQVVMTPNDVTLRKPGVVYTDMIDIDDKMYIFQLVVGGTRDLESFRRELDGAMGSVEAGEGVRDDPE